MTEQEFHEIDCSWDIKMDAYSSQNSCPTGIKHPKALLYNPAAESHSGFLEPILDKLEMITKSNGDVSLSLFLCVMKVFIATIHVNKLNEISLEYSYG